MFMICYQLHQAPIFFLFFHLSHGFILVNAQMIRCGKEKSDIGENIQKFWLIYLCIWNLFVSFSFNHLKIFQIYLYCLSTDYKEVQTSSTSSTKNINMLLTRWCFCIMWCRIMCQSLCFLYLVTFAQVWYFMPNIMPIMSIFILITLLLVLLLK